MPELYRLADATHVNTQVEAKHSGQPWEKVDVPTTRKELLAYLNELVNNVRGATSPQPAAAVSPEPEENASPPQPAPVTPPTKPAKPPAELTAIDVEEFILDHATHGQVESIFACLGTRFRELLKNVQG